MGKHRYSKAKNQTYHFQVRCDERLGVQIDRKTLIKRIQNRKFDEEFYFLSRQSCRVSKYRYKINDKWYIIPYDKNRHKVITIFEDSIQDVIIENNIDKVDIINNDDKSSIKKSDSFLIKFLKRFIENIKFNFKIKQ